MFDIRVVPGCCAASLGLAVDHAHTGWGYPLRFPARHDPTLPYPHPPKGVWDSWATYALKSAQSITRFEN